jgi:KDO2-lipid IV(A) lauroyltransferase
MKIIKYFFQASLIFIFFTVCKLIGYKLSSNLGSLIGATIGPFLRSKNLLQNNIKKAFSNIEKVEIDHISKNMWKNYGRILAEYVFIKHFRNSNFKKYISIEGEEILLNIKRNKDPVIFVSGHFNNFELLAMIIEKAGVDLAVLYRPLNNFFLNRIIVNLRKRYICKKQIPKGITGVKDMAKEFKKGTSLALMIDQRVSEGEKINFFDHPAYTTTLPAQFIKKYRCAVVPVHIERKNKYFFKVNIEQPIKFDETKTLDQITLSLNNWLEKKIIKKADQWIWSHNRWK